ncbi:flavodoxin family protein [Raineyella fluvialis]|uniref:Flavodoxin/nitric oxide synthase n=1 Tax=Raineyella fluvialis TaxID=2662261 RepID=A0A5Q2F6R0_9ACTN|nr:flavodoxin family protein [Raineyella fluvialis]QGF22672.1 flavodoxin/nitric oxide synthase [Raineyella fluvialis]
MSVLVIYESMFGHTKAIAEAAADGLSDALARGGAHETVTLVPVTDAPETLPDDITLLVLGGPTHAFSMSRESTREDALQQAHVEDAARQSTGLREWIEGATTSGSVAVVTFDTRVKKPFIPGSAAKAAAKALAAKGFADVERGETFWVVDTPGPLVDGELERAREWGASLADHV